MPCCRNEVFVTLEVTIFNDNGCVLELSTTTVGEPISQVFFCVFFWPQMSASTKNKRLVVSVFREGRNDENVCLH